MPESKSAIQGEQKLEHTGASHAMGSSPKAVKALYFFTAGLVDSGGSMGFVQLHRSALLRPSAPVDEVNVFNTALAGVSSHSQARDVQQ